MSKEVLKDMFKYFPSQIIPMILGFLSVPIFTRLFNPEDYGTYVLVVSTVSLLINITTGWLSMSVIRFYPIYSSNSKIDEFRNNIAILSLLSIIIISSISLAVSYLIKERVLSKFYYLIKIGIIFLAFNSFFQLLLSFLRIERRVNFYGGFSIFYSVVGLTLGLILVKIAKFGVEGLLWGQIICILIAIPLLWKVTLKGYPNSLTGISKPIASEIAKYSFPLVLGNIAAWILNLGDRYIIEFFRGSQEVGIYSASYMLTEKSIIFLFHMFKIASDPIGINIWEKEDKENSKRFMNKLAKYYLLVLVPAVIGLSVLAKPIINILVVKEYYDGYRAVPFIALGSFFLGLQQRFLFVLQLHKKTLYTLIIISFSGFINMILNVILIPIYGYMAAAVTTLVCYAILLILMIIASRRFFVWDFPFKSLIKAICASGIMGLLLYYISYRLNFHGTFNLALSVLLGVLSYTILLILFREITLSSLFNVKKK